MIGLWYPTYLEGTILKILILVRDGLVAHIPESCFDITALVFTVEKQGQNIAEQTGHTAGCLHLHAVLGPENSSCDGASSTKIQYPGFHLGSV